VFAQQFTQRGFIETGVLGYPQAAPGDSGHAVGLATLSYEFTYRVKPSFEVSGGFDARTDTHRQVERQAGLAWWDRERARPAFSVRKMSATYTKGIFTVAAGRQFIRWGKADILNPTDRFAPKDYSNVVKNDFLAVTAARLTVGNQSDSLDLIYVPRFTPSRTPLIGQRWVVIPPLPFNTRLGALDGGTLFPSGRQLGARWNHIGKRAEFSFSFYEGFNHLPLIDPSLVSRRFQPYLSLKRYFPKLRMYGSDAAVPLRWFTVKGETAFFTSSTPTADEYVIYVAQAERQHGEWLFVGGYAGQYVTAKRSQFEFAPDRGLTRAFLGRTSYTIDTNRSAILETVVRQNGEGAWSKIELTQAFRNHWRVTGGYTWIFGNMLDFLGQYRRNSHFSFSLRYSY
jgi:hypothetical protein